MPELRLDRDDLLQMLSRAEEIAAADAGRSPLEARFVEYLQVTDELGLPRQAVLRALHEQLGLQDLQVEPGVRLFAPSVDGFWYAASVVDVDRDRVRVRYDAGGQAVCDYAELRPFSLVPGMAVQACWKGNNKWHSACVRQYNAETNQITVFRADVYHADGVIELLPLDQVRLPPPKRQEERRPFQWVSAPGPDLLLKLAAGSGVGFFICRLLGG